MVDGGDAASVARDGERVSAIADRIARLGAFVDRKVSRDTCALIVGPRPGSRWFKAWALGIATVSEADFLTALDAAEATRKGMGVRHA